MLLSNSVETHSHPYTHYIINDIMKKDDYEQLLKDVLYTKDTVGLGVYPYGVGHKYGIFKSHESGSHLWHTSSVWRNLVEYTKSAQYIKYIQDITGYSEPFRGSKAEVSFLPADGGILYPHTDVPHKAVTLCIYFPTDGWDLKWGGELCTYTSSSPNDFTVETKVPFAANLGFLFVRSDDSFHGLPKLLGPSGEYRISVVINLFK